MQGASLHGPAFPLKFALTRVAGAHRRSFGRPRNLPAIGATSGDFGVYRHDPPELRATLGEVGPWWHPGGQR